MQMAGQRTVPLHITGPLLMNEPGLRKLAKLNVERTAIGEDRVQVKGLELGKADVPLVMADGVLTILPVDIPANDGVFHLEGQLDCAGTPPSFRIDKATKPVGLVRNLKLNHEMAAGPLAFIPLVWGSADNGSTNKQPQLAAISGLFNMQVQEAYLPLDNAALRSKGTAVGSFDVQNLTTDAPFFTNLMQALGPVVKITQPNLLAIRGGNIAPVTFNLANGRVTYTDLRLGTTGQSITFSGWVGLDMTLEMNISVSIKAKGLTALGGDVAIPVTLKGTVQKPKITVSGDAVKKTIENVAPGVIENLLNRGKK
jgi:hypothetical protein